LVLVELLVLQILEEIVELLPYLTILDQRELQNLPQLVVEVEELILVVVKVVEMVDRVVAEHSILVMVEQEILHQLHPHRVILDVEITMQLLVVAVVLVDLTQQIQVQDLFHLQMVDLRTLLPVLLA
jgi:hypothetical protein